MTRIETILICSMIKEKYREKTLGEVLPNIRKNHSNIKFNDCFVIGSGLSVNGLISIVWPVTKDEVCYHKNFYGFETGFERFKLPKIEDLI